MRPEVKSDSNFAKMYCTTVYIVSNALAQFVFTMDALMSVKNKFKGWLGEKFVATINWALLDGKVYRQLNNITLELEDGSTTQIDHVVISIYGIFVIETKDISGSIFGGEHDKTWTKKIENGKTYPIPNPLRQNYGHQCSLVEFLNIRCPDIGLSKADINTRIFSNIFLGPDAKLETRDKLPEGVSGSIHFIKSKEVQWFSESEVEQMFTAIQDGKLPNGLISGIATHRKHVKSLNERHNRKTGDPCPRCGEQLVTRKRKKNGREFVGCSGFPKCRYTK